MDAIKRGDIWTVSLLTHPKPRPGLIVSIDGVNDLCPDGLLIPITSYPAPLRVPLPRDPARIGLRVESFAKCESLGPVDKTRLNRRIGSVPPRVWASVEAGLRRVLGIFAWVAPC